VSLFKSILNIFKREDLKEAAPPTALPQEPAARPEAAQLGAAKGGTSLSPQESAPANPKAGGEEDWEKKQVRLWHKGEAILDTYRVEEVKSGGMGHVYIAEHPGWKMKVAIKAPNQVMLSDRSRFERVLREADAWTGLGLHPHIAYCYYTRPVEDIPYIFIEYVDGGSLRDWIREARCYDLKAGLDMAEQFCHGMEHAHSSGMTHRDIKPENILMTKEGVVKITDFGIARSGQAEEKAPVPGAAGQMQQSKGQRLTGLGTLGTYEYMSPQQHEDPRSADASDDIFSFGLCLYEMICGNRPFKAKYPYLAKIDKEEPADPLGFRDDLPADLASLMKKCCMLEREERPAGFKEIREQLIAIYRGIYSEDPPHAGLKAPALKADGLNNRGLSYYYLGREEEARRCWEEAIKVDPQHMEANFNLGYMKWNRGEITSSGILQQMRTLETAQEDNQDYWRCLGWLHLEQGDIEAVEKIQQSDHRIEDKDFLCAFNDPNRPEGRLLRVFEGHTNGVYSVVFSPDGSYVLSGSKEETLRLWEVASGRELRVFKGHTKGITSVAISPDGRFALSGSYDDTLRLWDVESGREVRVFIGHTGSVNSVAFSPDGRHALSGGWDETLRLWEVASGREVQVYKGHTGSVTSVTFSPDGRYALSGSSDHTMRLWEVASGREVQVYKGHTKDVTSVAISPDGRFALSGSYDDTLRLWDVESGREVRVFIGHTGSVNSVAFSPDGRFALSGSSDETLRLWDVESGRQLRVFEGHNHSVGSVTISPDGRYVLSGSRDLTLRLWEVRYEEYDFRNHPYPLLSQTKDSGGLARDEEQYRLAMKKAEKLMAEGRYREAYNELLAVQALPGFGRDRLLLAQKAGCGMLGGGTFSRLKSSWLEQVFEGHTSGVNTVIFSPDGRFTLSGSDDNTLRLRDVASGKEVRVFVGHKSPVNSVAFSPDGRFALSGSGEHNEGALCLWEVASGRQERVFEGHTGWVKSVAFSPDGRYVLSGSFDKTMRLWDATSGKEVRVFKGHADGLYSVVFSPDGRYTLSGGGSSLGYGRDYTLRLWEVASGKELRVFEGHTGSVSSVAFSRDGRYALSGSWDKSIRLWEVASGKEVRVFKGHTDDVNSVAFSPEGRYALSGSGDKTLRLWDVESGRQLRVFVGHTRGVNSVVVSSDGRYALSGSSDKTLRLWQFDWDWEF
jgi:WD40 repeat protein/serine/threonine protein kinase